MKGYNDNKPAVVVGGIAQDFLGKRWATARFFILPVEGAVRVRTGDKGENAI